MTDPTNDRAKELFDQHGTDLAALIATRVLETASLHSEQNEYDEEQFATFSAFVLNALGMAMADLIVSALLARAEDDGQEDLEMVRTAAHAICGHLRDAQRKYIDRLIEDAKEGDA